MIKADRGNNLMVRLTDGEDLIASLVNLRVESGVILNGVGMLRDVRLGYWNGSEYETEPIAEPVELLSLQGNFARKGDKEIAIHCHATVAHRGGAALGGHLLQATVHNTSEIFIYRFAELKLERKMEESGLSGLYPSII
jgi:hypothetical protein